MKLILIFSICFFCHSLFAGTIFEPTVTLGTGSGSSSVSLGNTTTDVEADNATVLSAGFRYGITRRYVHLTALVEGNIYQVGDDTEISGMGGFGIGWEWNIPLRTYILGAAYDFDTDLFGGGLEMAYYFDDKFWIGLRYMNFKVAQSVTIGTTPIEAEATFNVVSAVISFPFEFNYPDNWFRKTDWE